VAETVSGQVAVAARVEVVLAEITAIKPNCWPAGRRPWPSKWKNDVRNYGCGGWKCASS
jgi:hypothetical protein